MLLTWLGLLVCILIGLTLRTFVEVRTPNAMPQIVETLLALSRHPLLSEIHISQAESLQRLSERRDPVYRQLADERLQSLSSQMASLAAGKVEFATTEVWRVAYEELLRSPGLYQYRSVAWVESAHYWQDGPGEQSTQLNLELQQQNVIRIHRIAIIADHLWSESELFPVDPLRDWLDRQYRHGIDVRIVRESALTGDLELVCDFGIYGSRAIGLQMADPTGRTIRFTLDFNFEKVAAAEASWSRLLVYSVSWKDLLDRQH